MTFQYSFVIAGKFFSTTDRAEAADLLRELYRSLRSEESHFGNVWVGSTRPNFDYLKFVAKKNYHLLVKDVIVNVW